MRFFVLTYSEYVLLFLNPMSSCWPSLLKSPVIIEFLEASILFPTFLKIVSLVEKKYLGLSFAQSRCSAVKPDLVIAAIRSAASLEPNSPS